MADPKRALVTSPTIRNDDVDPDDWAEVVIVKGPIDGGTGVLNNGHQTVVGAVAVEVLAADPTRKAALVQNVGGANIRVGVVGVTATTGVRLIPDAIFIVEEPYVPTAALYAIAEGAASIALAMAVDA